MNDRIGSGNSETIGGSDIAGTSESPGPAWERTKGEPGRAYSAAWEYFKMGSARSHSAVAARLGKRVSQMQRWSTRWNWVIRAAAYDDHLVSLEQQAIAKLATEQAEKWKRRFEEHHEKKYLRGEKMEAKAEQMLGFPLATVTNENGKTTVHPARWRLKDAAVIAAAGSRMKEEALQETVGTSDVECEEDWLIENY